jgi:4-hydroxybenzoate polyprenyltransferase
MKQPGRIETVVMVAVGAFVAAVAHEVGTYVFARAIDYDVDDTVERERKARLARVRHTYEDHR